ncbi:MAG TPA: hypothetical protein PKC98_06240 [Candidatus Melainabacteria bacterium]|nr:hypothetical protein [Candidatus Melainabacteria bacterium]
MSNEELSRNNFQAFQDLCQGQIIGNEWMQDWPGSVDLAKVARVLRPLAQRFKNAENLNDDEVLAAFFSTQAVHLLKNLRNAYCFWVIAKEAAFHIGDYSAQINLPDVVKAMEAKPEIKKAIVV